MNVQETKTGAVAGCVALAALLVAGIVLGLSWLVVFPEPVLLAAWLIAFVAMIAVAVAAGFESRRLGYGPLRTIRQIFGDLVRFVLWFF